jgi:hypothetical protein
MLEVSTTLSNLLLLLLFPEVLLFTVHTVHNMFRDNVLNVGF